MNAPRALYVQIINGFSPEFRIFERLAGTAGGDLRASVLHNSYGDGDDGERFAGLERAGIAATGLDFGWRHWASRQSFPHKVGGGVRLLAVLPRALRAARAACPDVIVSSQQAWDCRVAHFLSSRLHVPQVIYLHYIVGAWLSAAVVHRLRGADHVVTVSEFIRDEALRAGVKPERVTAILNPVETPDAPPPGTRERIRAALGAEPGDLLLGNVSRLDPYKGQEAALRAFAAVLPRFPAARFVIVGTQTPWHTGYRGSLEALARDLGVANRVTFTGFRRDVPDLLAAFDVFIHPSRHEPFGQAVAEASQAGLPVVAYREGGIPEVVADGVTGLLSNPARESEGLAVSLAALFSDGTLRARLGAAGRARMAAPPFTPPFATAAFLRVLNGVRAARRATEPSSIASRRAAEGTSQ